MKINATRCPTAGGFTLVEMLTTMAIIAILIGLLVPAFGLIKNAAMTVRQNAQFEGIAVALESFHNEFSDYPPSNYYTLGTTTGTDYCGAQKLAEAVVGWDSFGVHPRTEWRSDGLGDWDKNGTYTAVTESLYHPSTDTTFETAAENRTVRKGPFLEHESSNAVKLSDIYPAGSRPANLAPDTYILADQFGKVTNVRTQKRTGMPILYFRANPSGFNHAVPLPWGGLTTIPRLVYNVRDNFPFYQAPPPFAPNATHPLGRNTPIDNEQTHFYDPTTDPDLTGSLPRPYRSDYLLLSAGKDGLYGTADDVWNFETGQ